MKLFDGQVHERDQFSLDFKGNHYKGIYHDGEITWFNPHPQQNLEDKQLTNIEEKVHEKMQNQLSTLNHFDTEYKMFEGQVHERDQFSLNFAGNTLKEFIIMERLLGFILILNKSLRKNI